MNFMLYICMKFLETCVCVCVSVRPSVHVFGNFIYLSPPRMFFFVSTYIKFIAQMPDDFEADFILSYALVNQVQDYKELDRLAYMTSMYMCVTLFQRV